MLNHISLFSAGQAKKSHLPIFTGNSRIEVVASDATLPAAAAGAGAALPVARPVTVCCLTGKVRVTGKAKQRQVRPPLHVQLLLRRSTNPTITVSNNIHFDPAF